MTVICHSSWGELISDRRPIRCQGEQLGIRAFSVLAIIGGMICREKVALAWEMASADSRLSVALASFSWMGACSVVSF